MMMSSRIVVKNGFSLIAMFTIFFVVTTVYADNLNCVKTKKIERIRNKVVISETEKCSGTRVAGININGGVWKPRMHEEIPCIGQGVKTVEFSDSIIKDGKIDKDVLIENPLQMYTVVIDKLPESIEEACASDEGLKKY